MSPVDDKALGELSPAARTIIAFEKNGAIDIAEPQQLFEELLAECPRPVRWEQGVAFFRFAKTIERPSCIAAPFTAATVNLSSRRIVRTGS